MCYNKAEGGPCLGHSSYTKFHKKYLKLSTGAPDAVIEEAYKELSKEGKHMQEPSKKEIEKAILDNKIELALDSNINEHDKKILNNRLDTALDEANKKGVTGKAWHVWTNLKSRVTEKMSAAGKFMKNKGNKIILATALMGSVAFGAAGCAPDAPKPAPSSSSQPSEAPKPVEAEVYGDAVTLIGADGQPVILENEHGTYEHVTINPEDESMTDFSGVDDASLNEQGFTHDQGVEAQKFAAKWAVEEQTDGPGLDSQAGYDKWTNENADTYFLPQYKNEILTNGGEDKGQSLLIAGPLNNSGPYIADGGARVSSTEVTVGKVYAYNNNGEKYIAVEGTTKVSYRISDEILIANTIKMNPGTTKEQIIAQYPKLDDGKENNVVRDTTFAYGMAPQADGTFKFSGYTINYDAETVNY